MVAALLAYVLPQTAVALGPGVSDTPSTTEPYYACPHGLCDAIIDPAAVKTAAGYELPDGGPLLEGSGEKGGYDPKDLQSAYSIPTTGGSEQTVAVIDAYGDKTAESDLAKYREKYELPACTKANGCFKKVNEKGEEGNYPETGEYAEEDWELETSLDLDMVSAACSHCHILLVEATTEGMSNLGASVNKAVELGATEASNSYGAPENYEPWCGTTGCSQYDSDYDHPGVVITASAGDYGYDNVYFGASGVSLPSFPATSPYVVAVGGTSLHKASNSRGWSEEVWKESERGLGTGSGCSGFESKPTWQTDKGCKNRTDNDIAGVAACETPLSIYSTTYGGWTNVCGTSASSPLLAAIDAHASEHTRSLGADAFYLDSSALFDVTAGSNGTCTPPAEDEYLCHAETGYDGPTGLGAPDGVPHVVGWSIEPTPSESGATESSATDVSCISSTECYAVAEYARTGRAHAAYAEKWNGTEWTIEGLQDPTGASESWAEGVTCTSGTACVAVGSYDNSAGTRVTLVEKWNGTAWTVQTSPNPSGATESLLHGVSCSSSTACTAVGRYVSSSGAKVTLAERWNGTEWAIQSTPNPTGSTETALHRITCTSSTSCTASGDEVNGHLYPIVERWNGTEWSIQYLPVPTGSQQTVIQGISCTASTACTAVGYYLDAASTWVTLAERWNGTEWSMQNVPLEPSATLTTMSGVSCSSSTSCVAVANYSTASRAEATYAVRWNGTEWSHQGFPDPSGAVASSMNSVSCTSSTACTAVGGYKNSAGTPLTLVEGYF